MRDRANTGRLRACRSFRTGAWRRGAGDFLTDSAGSFYLRIYARLPSFAPDRRERSEIRYGYVRVSPDGVVLDTLTAPEGLGPEIGESIRIYTRAGDRSPFSEEMIHALSPLGYLVAGFNATYAFSILYPNGTIDVEREGFRPVEVKARERAEWRARVAHSERRSGRSFEEVPSRKPAYRNPWVDADGRIWVDRYTEAVQREEPIPELCLEYLEGDEPRIMWAEPSLHDVYGPDGQLLRCIRVPDDSEVVASRGLLVWGIVRGALEEEYVVRWRVG